MSRRIVITYPLDAPSEIAAAGHISQVTRALRSIGVHGYSVLNVLPDDILSDADRAVLDAADAEEYVRRVHPAWFTEHMLANDRTMSAVRARRETQP